MLILAALGLAVTFGLMGVINMAHGDAMLGAYSTYAVQQFFRANLPGYIDYYLLAALPVGCGHLSGGRGPGTSGHPPSVVWPSA